MPIGAVVGAAYGALRALGIRFGGVPISRYGKLMAELAKARSLPDADKWARGAEKEIGQGEQDLARDVLPWYSVPGSRPDRSAAQELWARQIIGHVSQLPAPPLTAAEWGKFSTVDRGRDCLQVGLLPPAGGYGSGGSPVPIRTPAPQNPGGGGFQLPDWFPEVELTLPSTPAPPSRNTGQAIPARTYTLPTETVRAPDLSPVVILAGVGLVVLLMSRS